MELPTSREMMEPFIKLVARAPSLIASERADQLWREIFEERKWEIGDALGEAMFYATPADHRVSVTYAGLACVWSLATMLAK